MCYIPKRVKPTNHVRYAWKVLSQKSTATEARTPVQDYAFARGEWVKSPWPPGFYAGLTPKAAKQGACWQSDYDFLMKVRVRRINGRSGNTITAEEIFVPKDRGRRA